MPAFLNTFAKAIGLVIATGIIVAATLVCAGHLATPILEKHRADFEAYASKVLNAPVSIADVRIAWYQYQPQISLEGVTVYEPQTHDPVLQIKDVDIFVSIPQSLWQRKFVMGGVMVSGTAVNINTDSQGNPFIQGFPQFGNNDLPYTSQTKLENVLAWLTQEQRIILSDIDVHYTGINKEKRYVTLHNLSLVNSGLTHTVSGTATLHQKLPTRISLAVSAEGDTLDLNKITAKGYVYTSGLDLSQWFKGWQWHNWEIKQGITSNKIWFDWQNGQMQKLQILLQAYGIQLHSNYDNTDHTISRISGNFGWKRQDNNEIFAGEDVLLDMPSHLWPVSSFYISLQPDSSQHLQPQIVNIAYLNLTDITKFLLSSSDLSDGQRKVITALKPSGNVQTISMNFAKGIGNWPQVGVNATFDSLNLGQWEKYPGVNNLNGSIKWDGSQGEVDLASQQTSFHDDALFNNDIQLTQLTGALKIQHGNDDIWHVNVANLLAKNDDLNTNLKGNITIAKDMSPLVDLSADFSLAHAEDIPSYLPSKILDKDVADWLDHAFISGTVTSGHAVLRGLLNEFPFDGANGLFQLNANLNNASLHYAEDWPLIDNISANVDFTGSDLTVNASSANIMNIPLTNIHVELPKIGGDAPSVLAASSDVINTDYQHAFAFIHNSPLEESLGKMFKDVELSGPIKLNLGLRIPLSTPSTTKVTGSVAMTDATMKAMSWGLNVKKLQGNLQFTEDSVNADHIVGELFNKPLAFNLQTIKTKTDSLVEANFNSAVDVNDLQQWLHIPFSTYLKGSTPVAGKLDFSWSKPFELHLNSNLAGMAVNLPNEYSKTAEETRDFALDVIVDENKPLKIMVDYANKLSAALLMTASNNNYHLTAADIHLGSGPADWPDSAGLYLTGNFDTLDLSQMQTYLNDANQEGGSAFANLVLQGIDIQAQKLLAGGMTFPKISIQITPEKSLWLVGLESPNINGQLQIPKSFNNGNTITADFDNVNLPALEANSTNSIPTIQVKSLPPIIFNSKKTTYNGLPLGRVSFKTAPSAEGLTIQSFQVTSPTINLKAIGKWKQSDSGSSTQMQGIVVSSQVDNFLKSFGFDAHNFIVNDGKVNFNLGWNDAPYAFSINNLMGNLSLTLGKGRIADIGEENDAKMDLGRMLSIFSLQTIPRRLALDFSDVFEKGYSFDNVRGDFTIKNGSLYTHNFKFNGPIAGLGINGRIGIVNKDYDFTLVVTPYISPTSIPAALMLVQPVIGLAAFAVSNVIGPTLLSKATTYYYAVNGTWAHPIWKSITLSNRVKV